MDSDIEIEVVHDVTCNSASIARPPRMVPLFTNDN